MKKQINTCTISIDRPRLSMPSRTIYSSITFPIKNFLLLVYCLQIFVMLIKV